MNSTQAIILAAGKSTRFGNFFNKLLTPLCGKPLITHVIDTLYAHNIPTTVVVGHLKEQIKDTILKHTTTNRDITFVTQEEALGTGHALICSKEYWNKGNILVLNGDMPLINADLIAELVYVHTQSNAVITFITAIPDTTHHAYGRVIADGTGIHIVEAKDFTGNTATPYPINAGIYLFKRSFLEQHIALLQPNNAQKQLYITDLIGIASQQGLHVHTVACAYDLVRGVNTLMEFSTVHEIMRTRIVAHWLAHGVLIEDPTHAWIDVGVHIGMGTRIGSGAHIQGTTDIGAHCIIHPYTIIEQSTLGENVTVLSHSVVSHSTLSDGIRIGPFAHIQNTTTINNIPPYPTTSALEL